MFSSEKLQHFSIRKLTVGAASVLIGVSFLMNTNNREVHADTINETTQNNQAVNNSADTTQKAEPVKGAQEVPTQGFVKTKNANFQTGKEKSTTKTIDISEIVLSSTLAILSVGCIITIFFIIIECLSPFFNLFPENISAFLEGAIEITKGCLSLSELANVKLAVVLASFVISFGGISTLLQSLTMLQQVKMPVKLFALQKLSHALLSALISTILVLIFM